jgi:N-acetylmuramoyl-L-alanine amidase
VVRLVIELKGEVKPQVFSLKPVGEYGHRLVLDLHSAWSRSIRLMALLEKSGEAPLKAESRRPGQQSRQKRPAVEGDRQARDSDPKSPGWSPSSSIPDTVARILARSAAAAATRST